MQGPTATLGLYINSGSVYEEPYETGAPQHIFKYRCMQHLTCRTAIRLFPVNNAAEVGYAKLVRKLNHVVRTALMQGALTCWSTWPSRRLQTELTSDLLERFASYTVHLSYHRLLTSLLPWLKGNEKSVCLHPGASGFSK